MQTENCTLTQETIEQYAAYLREQERADNTISKYRHDLDMTVKPLKIQKSMFRDEGRELTKEEYVRLVESARQDGNERLALILQTICAAGIRISELKYITAEAVHTGRAEVSNKGKFRTVLVPQVKTFDKIGDKVPKIF